MRRRLQSEIRFVVADFGAMGHLLREKARSPHGAPNRTGLHHVVAALLSVALLFGACSDGEQATTGERIGSLPTAIPAAEIPGEMVDGFAPGPQDRVAVVGVAIGGHLPLRVLPGLDQLVGGEIPGTETELFGFNQNFQTDDNLRWWFVRWQDRQGWIDQAGAAYLGTPVDQSVTVAGTLTASTYATPGELIAAVGQQYTATPIVVEQLVDASVGTAVTTIDVMKQGVGQRGIRLTVTATADGPDAWRLSEVLETPMCSRGVAPEGTCK